MSIVLLISTKIFLLSSLFLLLSSYLYFCSYFNLFPILIYSIIFLSLLSSTKPLRVIKGGEEVSIVSYKNLLPDLELDPRSLPVD